MSDIHLGSKWSKAKEANLFLKAHTCETLILCGDIIDGWEILRGKKPKWKKRHTHFIKRLLSILPHTHIIYLRGNHDDFLDRILPLEIPNFTICRDYVYQSGERRHYVSHGAVFDTITSRFLCISQSTHVGYNTQMGINRAYHRPVSQRGVS